MYHDKQLSRIAYALGLGEECGEPAILSAIEELKSTDLRLEIRQIAANIDRMTAMMEEGIAGKTTKPKSSQLIEAISASGIKPGSKYKLDRDPEVKEFVLSMVLAGGLTYVQIADELAKRFGENRSISASSLNRYIRVMRRKHPEWR